MKKYLILVLVLAGLCSGVEKVFASADINSVTVNGGSVVTVAPGTSINVNINVTGSGSGSSNDWHSTGWLVSTTPPGAMTCVNTLDHNSGTNSENFSITAPGTAGTYNAYFVAYNNNGCTSGGALYTLTNSVIVAGPFTIATTAGSGGTINPSNPSVAYNANQTLTIVPNTGYVVSDVIVDSTSVGRKNTYTFNNVIDNQVMSATFDSGWSAPSSFSNNNSVTNPSYVYSSNNQYSVFNDQNDRVDYSGFGLSAPAGSNVSGIELAFEANRPDPRTVNFSLSTNGTTWTTGSGSKNSGNVASTDTTYILGGPSDLWNRTWTPADLANLRVRVDAQTTGPGDILNLDQLQVKIYYKTTPTISVTNSPVTYNGSAQSATVTGSVAGTVSNVLYNGSATVPTDAGTYAVTADFAPTDTASYNSLVGASAGNFVINKASSTTAITCTDVTYTGVAQTPCTVSVTGAGSLSLTPDPVYSNNTNAGTAGASYTFAGDANHNGSSDSKNFNIAKADATINVTGFTGTYDSLTHGATGTATGVLGESLSGLDLGSSFRNVTGGTANWTFTDVTGNYNNANGSVDIVINQRPLNVTVTGVNKIHDGNTSATVILGSDKISGDDVTLSYSSASFDTADSGADKVVTVDGIAISGGADAGNYNLVTPPTSTTANISPEAAIISLNGSLNVDYDGASHALTASTDPSGKSYVILYNGSTNDPVNAGTYSVFAQITDPNYAGQTTATLVINKINQSTLTVTGLPEGATYKQTGITAGTAGGNGEGAVTFSAGGSSACSVSSVTGVVTITSGTGTCSITATKAADVNYNETTSDPVSITISKADQTITFGELGDKTMGDPDFGVTATSDSELLVTFTAEAEGPCSIVSGPMIHLLAIGTCTVTAHQGGDDNYNPAEDVARSFVIAELTHTITASSSAHGTISPSDAVTVADGSDKTFTMTPASGYKVVGVKVDGDSVGAVTTYTFTGVTSDHSIEASFDTDPSQQGGGGGGGAHGVLPVGEVLGASTVVGTEIAGCGMRTTGYSTVSGVSCEHNKPHSEGEVLGAQKFIFTQWMRLWLPRSEVTELQKRLTAEGFYTGSIDGKFGPLTDKAVREYQKANPPLRIDGIVGPKTRAVLNK